MFPQIVSPVLHFLPRGVGSITLVFGSLQIICVMIILYVLSRYVKNPLIFGVGSLALLMVTSGAGQLFGYRFEPLPDPCFQYWPIRFVMPSISLIVVFFCFSHLTWRRVLALSIFNALALFWNIDSGVAIIYAECMLFLLLSILGFKAARQLGGWPPALHLVAVGVVPIASLIFYGAAVLSLGLFSGHPINPEWIAGYQSVFYSLGFFMIPMPAKPDAWQTMISVYLIALVLGLSLASDGLRMERILPLLYVPLLGAGLFVCYQGRSHFFNLVSVSWPLIFVATILIDWHLRGVRQKMVSPLTLPLPIAGLACLLVPAIALITGLPILYKAGLRFPFEQKHAYYFPNKVLQSELELVRRNCQGDPRQCLLLIKRQGIYAVEAKTASAFLGASPIELLLKKDFLRMKREIRDGRFPKILLAAGSEQEVQHLHLDSGDLRMYRVAQINKERTVKVLERR